LQCLSGHPRERAHCTVDSVPPIVSRLSTKYFVSQTSDH
jgi:hypothetical protein